MIKRIVFWSAISAGSWSAFVYARRWYETWGVDRSEATKDVPGDELVPAAELVDTRGLTIDAPPAAIWPWLVQMGYGRGGWYSYDAIDMKGTSATAVLPEHQHLDVGDVVPTDPGGGFVAKVVEPERALVLYVDTEVIAARTDVAQQTPGLAASGRFLETATSPRFSASWAFVLEPLEGGRTRLIERFRGSMEQETRGTRLLGPLLQFGMFVMIRRQMLGLRERAERLARDRAALDRDLDEVVARATEGGAEAAPTAS